MVRVWYHDCEEEHMPNAGGAGRTNQKTRTRMAIVDACRDLIRTGGDVAIPEVARLALVSEATVYRYFPDLASLVNEAIVGLWPSPAEALRPVAHSTNPTQRIAFASELFLRRVVAYQGAVRAMIAATISRPGGSAARPGLRFAWIDEALAPAEAALAPNAADALTRLKRDLAIVVSPEALFILIDLVGLSPDEAVASASRLAATITEATLAEATLAKVASHT
jgi:AcrR family transcriptional regulator